MAAKISFPNRPCPKCGKPIHIKTSSHECGWKATATAPSSKGKPAKTASSNGKAMSKMEAVRRVLAESGKDTMPMDIQDQLKKKFSIKMDTATISTYKGTILRTGSGKKKKMGRPKGRKLGRPAGVQSSAKANGSANISLDDIRAVKELAEKLGAEKLRQLAEVLTK